MGHLRKRQFLFHGTRGDEGLPQADSALEDADQLPSFWRTRPQAGPKIKRRSDERNIYGIHETVCRERDRPLRAGRLRFGSATVRALRFAFAWCEARTTAGVTTSRSRRCRTKAAKTTVRPCREPSSSVCLGWV